MPKGLILLVEDNTFQAKQTIACLERDDYQVIWAETGLTGFKMVKIRRPV